MAKHWFIPKTYGYGVCPINRQGWIASLALILMIAVSFYTNIYKCGRVSPYLRDWLRYMFDTVVLVTLFLVAVKDKVEGGLKWRWGKG